MLVLSSVDVVDHRGRVSVGVSFRMALVLRLGVRTVEVDQGPCGFRCCPE